jgi:two-component system, LytTR family, response regulator
MHQELTAMIIDDESVSCESLRSLVHQYCEAVSVFAACETVDGALQELSKGNHPNIVFLDVNMKGETGFDFLRRVENRDFEVIFTTAYSEFAIQAFKFSAIDYLMKPIDISDLRAAIDKVRNRLMYSAPRNYEDLIFNINQTDPSRYRITLSTAQGLTFVKPAEIACCIADGNYTVFHLLDNRKIMVSQTLKTYDDLLTPRGFFRVHHSALINLDAVQHYHRGEGGRVVLKNGQAVDVAKRRKDDFLRQLQAVS